MALLIANTGIDGIIQGCAGGTHSYNGDRRYQPEQGKTNGVHDLIADLDERTVVFKKSEHGDDLLMGGVI